MKKYIKVHSNIVGVAIGFLSFYIFSYWTNISWMISFMVAFAFGYLVSKADFFAGKITQDEIDGIEARKISDTINNFEENG